MDRKPLIYVAGAYSGNVSSNVNAAIHTADLLRSHNFIPFVPHLTLLWDTIIPHDYEFRLDLDFQYLLRCDGLFRMLGRSPGADREVDYAKSNGIPVFYTIYDMEQYFCENA